MYYTTPFYTPPNTCLSLTSIIVLHHLLTLAYLPPVCIIHYTTPSYIPPTLAYLSTLCIILHHLTSLQHLPIPIQDALYYTILHPSNTCLSLYRMHYTTPSYISPTLAYLSTICIILHHLTSLQHLPISLLYALYYTILHPSNACLYLYSMHYTTPSYIPPTLAYPSTVCIILHHLTSLQRLPIPLLYALYYTILHPSNTCLSLYSMHYATPSYIPPTLAYPSTVCIILHHLTSLQHLPISLLYALNYTVVLQNIRSEERFQTLHFHKLQFICNTFSVYCFGEAHFSLQEGVSGVVGNI